MDIKGKNVVIVGATGGIGRALSFALASSGANMALVGRRMLILKALEKEIKALGFSGKIFLFKTDIAHEKEINRLAKKVGSVFACVDLLINAAGIGVYKKLEDLTFEDWKRTIDINLTAPFLTIKAFITLLSKSKKSLVISMGSGMGKVAVSGRLVYCASKFGLRGLMLSLAKEYKNTNIRFCLLTLGSVMTSFGPLTLDDKKEKEKEGKKYLDPVDLAKTIVAKIKNDTLKNEISIYPKDYYEQSREGFV
jgi:3-oxoacyl-[acyl-carrier protein] reductase